MIKKLTLFVFVILLALAGSGGYLLYERFIGPSSTYTIKPTPDAILKSAQALARLETMTYTVEKIIDIEKTPSQGVISDLLFGDKLLLIATGEVVAGIDLTKLTAADISITDDTMTIHLPAPEVFSTRLDETQTRVYDRKTGILNKPDADLESQARQRALEQIRAAACKGEVLKKANESAVTQMTQLAKTLGLSKITVRTTDASCR